MGMWASPAASEYRHARHKTRRFQHLSSRRLARSRYAYATDVYDYPTVVREARLLYLQVLYTATLRSKAIHDYGAMWLRTMYAN